MRLLTMDGGSYFEHAAHQNADGVLCLQKGDELKAFQLFMSALSTLNKLRYYQRTRHHQSQIDPSLSCSTDQRRYRCCRAVSVPNLEDEGFYIYSNALVFSRKPEISKESDPSVTQVDTIAFCEAVALFNLGLVYHHKGKRRGEDRALLGALDLYEHSLATLLTIKTADSDDVNVLKLAVMNNRVHILNEMVKFQSARSEINDLLIQSVKALSSKNGESLAFLTRAEIDNFLLNALVIRRFNTAPCA